VREAKASPLARAIAAEQEAVIVESPDVPAAILQGAPAATHSVAPVATLQDAPAATRSLAKELPSPA